LLLTGDARAACEILKSVFALASHEIAQYRNKDRRQAWIFRQIRAHALQWPQGTPGDAASLPVRVCTLPEPARSAFALFHSLDENIEAIADILRLPVPAFARELAKARQQLAPGTAFPENSRLALHRPWAEDRKPIAKAVRAARENPELLAQIKADGQWHQAIENLPLPEALAELNLVEPPKPGLRAVARHPAMLSIALALLVVVGSVSHLMINRMSDFTGKETIENLVDEAATLTGSEFEPISPTKAGELDDWFVMKGFEGFSVPSQFQKAKAVGCRILKHDGAAVAQVALDQRNAMLFVFRVADMKIQAEGANWRIFQEDDWAVAVHTDQRNGTVVMFQGDDSEMPGFLQTVGQ
jgi:hypothetical protein